MTNKRHYNRDENKTKNEDLIKNEVESGNKKKREKLSSLLNKLTELLGKSKGFIKNTCKQFFSKN